MNKIRLILFLCFCTLFGGFLSASEALLLPSDKVKSLLNQMTLDEKIAQMKNYNYEVIRSFVNDRGEINTDSLKKHFPYGIGNLGLPYDLDPTLYVKIVNQLRKYNQTCRIKIPPLFIGEGLHGFMAKNATVFPQAIALGCTWNPDLLEKIFSATAQEASARGVKQLFSPVLDLAREPRFGRTEEMYSEDAYLVSMCGQAAVWGFQGRGRSIDKQHVAVTLKHYVGHGQPEGGRNTAPIDITRYDLMNTHLLPFEKCIQAGALSVMPSYNEMGGQPNHANHWLLNNILRKTLGFSGMIISDQDALREMFLTQHVAGSMIDAAKIGIENDIAIDLRYSDGAYDYLKDAVKSGKITEKQIDNEVLQILTLKDKLGLFDAKELSVNEMLALTNSSAHKALALKAAREALVLLKNQANILPLDSAGLKTIAVIGPLAKGVHYGGYTAEPRYDGTDVLEGIQNFSNGRFNVLYAEGCKLALEESSFWKDDRQTPNSPENEEILLKQAAETAAKSDVVVLALGETESFCREAWSENHLGDRENLDLIGDQNRLVEAVLKTGKPVVVLMFGGRPLSFNYVSEKVPAIVQVFYPGQEGGTAIADVLFGKVNPSGKLSVTIPKSVGQLPCYYSHKPSLKRSYIGFPGAKPLYPFGYGLSYTTFSYSTPKINKTTIRMTDSVEVSVDVTNIGAKFGEEIAQLYIHDEVSSLARPVKELKDFKRIALKVGETKTLSFIITPDKLSFYNLNLEKIIEPGNFDVMIGPNSEDLQSVTFSVVE